MGRPPLSRLRRRFAPLHGTQPRCVALRATPPGRYAPRALRAQPFWEHEKKAGGGSNSVNPASVGVQSGAWACAMVALWSPVLLPPVQYR